MVRTKEVKVVLGKSSRKKVASTVRDDTKLKGGKYSGGNPVCQRETPVWQKPITNFFKHVTEIGPLPHVNSNKILPTCPDVNMTEDLEVKQTSRPQNAAGHSFVINEEEEDGSNTESLLMTCVDDYDEIIVDSDVEEEDGGSSDEADSTTCNSDWECNICHETTED